jgi:hypothetical protein
MVLNFVTIKRIEKVFATEDLNSYMERIEDVLDALNQIDQEPAEMADESAHPSAQDEVIVGAETPDFPVLYLKLPRSA